MVFSKLYDQVSHLLAKGMSKVSGNLLTTPYSLWYPLLDVLPKSKCTTKIFTATKCRTFFHTLSIEAISHNDIVKFEVTLVPSKAIWKNRKKCGHAFPFSLKMAPLRKHSLTKIQSKKLFWYSYNLSPDFRFLPYASERNFVKSKGYDQ